MQNRPCSSLIHSACHLIDHNRSNHTTLYLLLIVCLREREVVITVVIKKVLTQPNKKGAHLAQIDRIAVGEEERILCIGYTAYVHARHS